MQYFYINSYKIVFRNEKKACVCDGQNNGFVFGDEKFIYSNRFSSNQLKVLSSLHCTLQTEFHEPHIL